MQAATTWATRLLLALLVAGAAAHLVLRLRLLNDPRIDLGGAEINVAYGIQKLLLGRPLYTDPEQPPFEAIQLAPLFHLLGAGLAKATGVDAMDTWGLFAVGRALALVLNLAACSLLFLLCRRAGASVAVALGLACIGLAMITEHSYGRSDALATPLLLAAVMVVAQGEGRGLSWQRAAGAAALSALAVLAKQTAAIAPFIIVIHLISVRDGRSLLRFVAAGTLAAGLVLLGLLCLAAPEVLLKNLVGAVRNGVAPSLYRDLFDQGIFKYHAGWHLLVVASGIALWRSPCPAHRLLGQGALLAFVAGLAGGLKSGSGLNYLVDGQLLALASVPALVPLLPERFKRWALPILLLYGALFMQHRTRLLAHRVGTVEQRLRREQELAADAAVRAWLRGRWGDDRGHAVLITYRGHLELLLSGVALLPQKDIIQWSTAPPFQLGRLKAMLEDGRVELVIADAPLDRLRLLGWSYPIELVAEVDGRCIYRIGAD